MSLSLRPSSAAGRAAVGGGSRKRGGFQRSSVSDVDHAEGLKAAIVKYKGRVKGLEGRLVETEAANALLQQTVALLERRLHRLEGIKGGKGAAAEATGSSSLAADRTSAERAC